MVRTVPYEVIRRLERTELRRYGDLMVATVRDLEDDESFGLLFQYIDGKNDRGSKLPMTAPVISRSGVTRDIGTGKMMSFVLPWDHEPSELPRPNDPRVMLESIEGGLFAALSFRGRAGREDVERMTGELLEELKDVGVAVDGTPFLMRYNSPFAPGFIRHNEVAVRVVPGSYS